MLDRAVVASELEQIADHFRRCANVYPDFGFEAYEQAVRDALALLREQEPEIIRCKDCKHYDLDIQTCNNGVDGILLPDWFCADGERR